MQIVLTVEFQLKATLAFAVDDFHAPAQRLAQVPLALGYIVHFQDDLLFLRRFLAHVLAQQLRLTDGEAQCCNLLSCFQLLFFGFQLQNGPGMTGSQLSVFQLFQHRLT